MGERLAQPLIRDMCSCSVRHVRLFATPWSVACQAPLSMGHSRPEYWSGWPRPPPGALPNPGIKLTCLTSPALAGRFLPTSSTWEAPKWNSLGKNAGEGYHFLLQWIFLTQGLNPCLLLSRQILYHGASGDTPLPAQ